MWIFIVSLALLIPILAIILDSEFGKAVARRLDRKGPKLVDGGVHDRLAHLEGEVERLGRDVGRLEDESQFFQRLLSERSESGDRLIGDKDETADPDP